MNELNKLLGSLLLVGGGFLAAALIGPPELADRLSQLVQPSETIDADGLRPLPANADRHPNPAWGQQTATPQQPSSRTQPDFTQPASGGFAAPPQEPITRAASSEWPDLPTPSQPAGATPPDDAWLTTSTFDFDPAPTEPAKPSRQRSLASMPPARPLEPVARRRAADAEPAEPTVAAAGGWPELRAPLPLRLEPTEFRRPDTPPLADSTPVPSPSLSDSPYGDRPQFDAFADAARSESPVRFGSINDRAAPVERTPLVKQYRKHVVTDGDTLPRLAQRYLGDASRAEELFELNRDRLEHPDVLPIGLVIKTPEAETRRFDPQPGGNAARLDAFPPLQPGGSFTTVAATDDGFRGFASDIAEGLQRPMSAVGAPREPSLTREQQLGPVDPIYNNEVSWDANRW